MSEASKTELLAACKRLVSHFVGPHPHAVGPGGLFCDMCGRNSTTETHSDNCMIKQAQDAIAKAEAVAEEATSEKLVQMVIDFDAGKESEFWAEARKLSRPDRVRLVGMCRGWGKGGTVWAFDVASRFITETF